MCNHPVPVLVWPAMDSCFSLHVFTSSVTPVSAVFRDPVGLLLNPSSADGSIGYQVVLEDFRKEKSLDLLFSVPGIKLGVLLVSILVPASSPRLSRLTFSLLLPYYPSHRKDGKVWF